MFLNQSEITFLEPIKFFVLVKAVNQIPHKAVGANLASSPSINFQVQLGIRCDHGPY